MGLVSLNFNLPFFCHGKQLWIHSASFCTIWTIILGRTANCSMFELRWFSLHCNTGTHGHHVVQKTVHSYGAATAMFLGCGLRPILGNGYFYISVLTRQTEKYKLNKIIRGTMSSLEQRIKTSNNMFVFKKLQTHSSMSVSRAQHLTAGTLRHSCP